MFQVLLTWEEFCGNLVVQGEIWCINVYQVKVYHGRATAWMIRLQRTGNTNLRITTLLLKELVQ